MPRIGRVDKISQDCAKLGRKSAHAQTQLHLQGLDSVIDDPTFLEDGCKLEAAISRAATSIVSEDNYVEFFRLSSTSQKKLAFLFFLSTTLDYMLQPIYAFPVFRLIFCLL